MLMVNALRSRIKYKKIVNLLKHDLASRQGDFKNKNRKMTKRPPELENSCFLPGPYYKRFSSIKDIPAQWAKIRQGLDTFRISSKCVCLSNGEV